MIYGKDECRAYAEANAAVLVYDGNDRLGTPIFTVRKAVGCDFIRMDRNSIWYIQLNGIYGDNCDKVDCGSILGFATDAECNVMALTRFINGRYAYIPSYERKQLIDDAQLRLKEA